MKYLLILPGVLVLLVLIAVVRTLVSPRKTSGYQPPQTDEAEALRLAGKLSKMIQVDTTSHAGGDDPARFRAFHKTLAELFPRVFSQLEKTEIDGNLLFYWKGRSQERPILLMSHQDVVPAEGAWSHAPFSGDIADGKVWGRGASDTKCSVMAFFEAAEQLLAEGYTPPTDVYLASSCTEEWAGDGAPKLVAELQRRGVELFLVCDEGGAIISEPIGGIPGNFAMVGVFEKGKADVKFTAKSTGGHASAPGKHTPIARLAAFVTEVETHSPFKKKLLPEVAAMFRTLAPYASSFGLRLLLGNLWLFAPLLKLVLPAVSAQAARCCGPPSRLPRSPAPTPTMSSRRRRRWAPICALSPIRANRKVSPSSKRLPKSTGFRPRCSTRMILRPRSISTARRLRSLRASSARPSRALPRARMS